MMVEGLRFKMATLVNLKKYGNDLMERVPIKTRVPKTFDVISMKNSYSNNIFNIIKNLIYVYQTPNTHPGLVNKKTTTTNSSIPCSEFKKTKNKIGVIFF
jgi:hypothetical protein